MDFLWSFLELNNVVWIAFRFLWIPWSLLDCSLELGSSLKIFKIPKHFQNFLEILEIFLIVPVVFYFEGLHWRCQDFPEILWLYLRSTNLQEFIHNSSINFISFSNASRTYNSSIFLEVPKCCSTVLLFFQYSYLFPELTRKIPQELRIS